MPRGSRCRARSHNISWLEAQRNNALIANLRLLTGTGPAPTLFYSGIGFRFWDQYLKDAELEATGETIVGSGYDRGYRYGYLPLGVRLEPSMGNRWTVHLEAEYQVVFWGEVYTDFVSVAGTPRRREVSD